MSLRILVVDDEQLARDELCFQLEQLPEPVEVVGQAANGPEALAAIDGVYVPSHWTPRYAEDGTLLRTEHVDGLRCVPKRVVTDLDKVDYPTTFIVPHLQVVHDRVAVEIQRGCTQGCRFCQAGYIYRPTRQRSPEKALAIAQITKGSNATQKRTNTEDLLWTLFNKVDFTFNY